MCNSALGLQMHLRLNYLSIYLSIVLPVVITGNDGPVLMGRKWLSMLKLDWGRVR